MVTHDQDEALSMADRIVEMAMGRIVQVGSPAEINDQPATRFVAVFVGSMKVLTTSLGAPGTVHVGDLHLSCKPNGHAAGSPVTLAIRPEDVQLVEDAEGAGPNLMDVKVGEVEFPGPHVRARPLHRAFETRPMYAQLSRNLVRRRGVAEGVPLQVRLAEDRLRIHGAEPTHD